MRRLLVVMTVLLIFGSGVVVYRAFMRGPSVAPAPVLNPVQVRQQVQVPGVRFTDVTKEAGIQFVHTNGMAGKKLLPETMGSGVAVIDFDQDGKPDLFFVNSCPWPGQNGKSLPKLYHNRGNGKFEDVSEQYGFTEQMFGMGAAVGDFNNDGFPDLFISCVGKNYLFRNKAGKSFEDISQQAGVAGNIDLPNCTWPEFLKLDQPIPFGSSATFVDYDGDGWLDLFIGHYVSWSPAIDLSINSTATGVERSFGQPRDFNGSQCQLFRNVDGTRFVDVSAESGIHVYDQEGVGNQDRRRSVGKALGVIVCDPDNDGWPDLVVANDTVRNFYFHNELSASGKRVFREMGIANGSAYPDDGRPRGGMGIDWAEFRPGKSALLVANFAQEPITFLQRSIRDNSVRFTDTALAVGLSGASRQPLKFGTFFFDYDLDGRLDLFIANGHIEPEIAKIQGGQSYAQSAQLYWNTGEERPVFEPVPAEQCGEDLLKPLVGRGAAYLDYDGDGDLDIVITGNGGEARLLRNDCKIGHHYVRILLQGQSSNRSAIGAVIRLTAAGKTHERIVAGAKGYLSQSEFPITIGLGSESRVDRVEVRWPGKADAIETWENLAADRLHRLLQGTGKIQ